jgi:lipid II:glycine glycyltransferase (peptidoglycan interpeptide bridge formation enzyme)
MSMRSIANKNIWNAFVQAQSEHTFLHSWEWGEFNARTGDMVWRMGAYEGEELYAVALVILVHARRGNFLFVPHGPVLKGQGTRDKGQMIKILVEELKKIAKKEKVHFIRISPLLEDSEENKNLFQKLGFRPAPIHMHAETTWALDLQPSEEELLRTMRKTTRNLVRRAERDGVRVTMGADTEDIKHFYRLHEETVQKHQFVPFSYEYIASEIEEFTQEGNVAVFLGWYQGAPIVGAVIIFYGNSAFYHHGASSLAHPKVPAAYLVQWAAIREAKRRGKKFYNFWGIAPGRGTSDKGQETSKHPWAGLTLFKMGFGGFRTDYLHAQDLPLSWRYWPNWVLETVRKKMRGL